MGHFSDPSQSRGIELLYLFNDRNSILQDHSAGRDSWTCLENHLEHVTIASADINHKGSVIGHQTLVFSNPTNDGHISVYSVRELSVLPVEWEQLGRPVDLGRDLHRDSEILKLFPFYTVPDRCELEQCRVRAYGLDWFFPTALPERTPPAGRGKALAIVPTPKVRTLFQSCGVRKG